MRSARTVLGATAATVTVAAALAGCSAQPGTAAVVDGRTITQSQLEDTHADLAPVLEGLDVRTTLVTMIVAPFFIEAAEENGVGVSADQAEATARQSAEQAGTAYQPLGEDALEVVRFTMAAQQLQTLPDGAEVLSDVEEQIFAADLDVNPRYGDLDEETGQLVRAPLPWIVQTGE